MQVEVAAVAGMAVYMRLFAAGLVRMDCSQSAAERIPAVDTAELVDTHSRTVGTPHLAAPSPADSVRWNRRNQSDPVRVP